MSTKQNAIYVYGFCNVCVFDLSRELVVFPSFYLQSYRTPISSKVLVGEEDQVRLLHPDTPSMTFEFDRIEGKGRENGDSPGVV